MRSSAAPRALPPNRRAARGFARPAPQSCAAAQHRHAEERLEDFLTRLRSVGKGWVMLRVGQRQRLGAGRRSSRQGPRLAALWSGGPPPYSGLRSQTAPSPRRRARRKASTPRPPRWKLRVGRSGPGGAWGASGSAITSRTRRNKRTRARLARASTPSCSTGRWVGRLSHAMITPEESPSPEGVRRFPISQWKDACSPGTPSGPLQASDLQVELPSLALREPRRATGCISGTDERSSSV